MRRLAFGVTVEDPSRWNAEHRAQADTIYDDGGSPDDWVVEQLEEVMCAAGNRFVAENPDLFRGEVV